MSQNSSQPVKPMEKLDNFLKDFFSPKIECIKEHKYLSCFIFSSCVLVLALYLGEYTWLFSLIVLLLAAYIAWRKWIHQHFLKEWGELIHFLYDNSKFMNEEKTEKYKENFKDDDLVKYVFVARLCIAFIDDMYFLNYKNELDAWFKGSIKVLVQPHRKWFEDNHDSYDQGFIDFIQERLTRLK